LEPYKLSSDFTQQSPQNDVPKKEQFQLKKASELSQTSEEHTQYMKQKTMPVANDFIPTKYSPISFTKVKIDENNVP
jgi:hypothetical protein